uniref:G_PROTEIN_RECEP_F1_2 domain-containing protein n=1 Tax=Panagrellus redivivus TaxID=6233 RepID=A0A7E4V7W6_PANRE
MTEFYIFELRVLPTTILILMILGYGRYIDFDSDDAECWLVNLGTALAAASCFRKSRRKFRMITTSYIIVKINKQNYETNKTTYQPPKCYRNILDITSRFGI